MILVTTEPLGYMYCISFQDREVVSNGTTMIITFQSDFSISYGSWKLSYTASDPPEPPPEEGDKLKLNNCLHFYPSKADEF